MGGGGVIGKNIIEHWVGGKCAFEEIHMFFGLALAKWRLDGHYLYSFSGVTSVA
jgi:hypothetical protein